MVNRKIFSCLTQKNCHPKYDGCWFSNSSPRSKVTWPGTNPMNDLQTCEYKCFFTALVRLSHEWRQIQFTNACLLQYFEFEIEDKFEWIEFDSTRSYIQVTLQKTCSYNLVYKLVNRSLDWCLLLRRDQNIGQSWHQTSNESKSTLSALSLSLSLSLIFPSPHWITKYHSLSPPLFLMSSLLSLTPFFNLLSLTLFL